MNGSASNEFVRQMTEGLFGGGAAPVKENKHEPEAPVENIADKRAININFGTKSLTDAFNGVTGQNVEEEKTLEEQKTVIIDEYKKEAEEESLGILAKMLKGMK